MPLLIISGPTGVGKRHAVRQGLKMAGREVEVFILDWADERLRGDAVAVLTRLQPVVRAGHCLLVLCESEPRQLPLLHGCMHAPCCSLSACAYTADIK